VRAIARGKNIAEREGRVKITKKKTKAYTHTHTHIHTYTHTYTHNIDIYNRIKEGGGKMRTVVKL